MKKLFIVFLLSILVFRSAVISWSKDLNAPNFMPEIDIALYSLTDIEEICEQDDACMECLCQCIEKAIRKLKPEKPYIESADLRNAFLACHEAECNGEGQACRP